MNVYLNTKGEGFWPVGFAAVVVANDTEEATTLLRRQMELRYLKPDTIKEEDFVQLAADLPKATIVCDGNY